MTAPLTSRWRETAGRMLGSRLETARTLRRRFSDDRLAMTAGSLTFTTLISVVPLATVMLAIFSAFPMFAALQESLQKYFLRSLIPASIAQTVLGTISQFSSRASRLGILGLVVLVVSALAMMLTIDRALNSVWHVRRPKPLAQRVLLYWSAVTLGPVLVGLSLTLTSYLVSASRGMVQTMPEGFVFLLAGVEFVLIAGGTSALFHYVPNTHVRWRHAISGGLFVAIGLAGARQLLAFYLSRVPTYAVVYGAFATLPIFLIWIYFSWLVVLFGAVVAAYAPMLHRNVVHWANAPGARFHVAVLILRELAQARVAHPHGSTVAQIADALQIDPLQSGSVLDGLIALDWVGKLDEAGAPRHVLVCDPARTSAAPLLALLLLERAPELEAFWQRADFDAMTLADLIADPAVVVAHPPPPAPSGALAGT